MRTVGGAVTRLSEWIARLAWLNILWLFFTLAGLVVIGVFPATAAGYQLLRDILRDPEHDAQRLASRYWALVRTRLLSANLSGYAILVVGYLLYAGLSLAFGAQGAPWQLPLVAAMVLASVAFIGIVVHLPFIAAHLTARPWQLVQASLHYALAHPLGTLIIVAAVVAQSYLLGALPAAAVFFLFSPIAALTVLLDLRGFTIVERRSVQAQAQPQAR